MPETSEEKPDSSAQASISVIKLDSEQFTQVVTAVAKSKRKAFTIDDLTQIFNILALVAGGLWALHEYYGFQQESQKLELRRRHFELQQQQVSAKLLSLDETIKRAEAGFASEAPLKFSIETAIDKIGKHGNLTVYWVQLRINVHNQSKNPVDINAAHVKVFLGTLAPMTQQNPIVRLSGPYRPNGTIAWDEVINTQYYAPSNDDATDAERVRAGAIIACPALGRLVYNEDFGECGLDYRVVARPDQFIGMTESFTVMRDAVSYPYDFDQWRQLRYEGRQAMSGVPVSNETK